MITIYVDGDCNDYLDAKQELRRRGIFFKESMKDATYNSSTMIITEYGNVFVQKIIEDVMRRNGCHIG